MGRQWSRGERDIEICSRESKSHPRNQRIRRPRAQCRGRFRFRLPKRQYPRQIAHKLDGVAVLLRDHSDLLEKAAYGFCCLNPRLGGIQRLGEIAHLGAIACREPGMQPDRRLLAQFREFGLQFRLARLHLRELVLHALMEHAVGDRIDDLRDLAADLAELLLEACPAGAVAVHEPVVFAAVLLHELLHEIGVHQVLLQPLEHPRLDLAALDQGAIAAGALVTCRRAAIPLLVDQGVARPAAAAFEQS